MLGLSPKSLTTVRRATREPIISQGPVGRQAWNGQTATVFGCTGFLGRYVVSALATQGTRVIIPYRGISENTRHLKPSGDLGMVIPMEFDIRNRTQVEEVMRHSDVVINLIGRNYETKNFTLEMVNIDAPARIAEIAQNVGVARFIHVSSLCADPNSKSAVYSTKGKAESYLKANFPDTTIIRPATMFDWKDSYLTVNGASNKLRPVDVDDVAKAINAIVQNEWTLGKVFELLAGKAIDILPFHYSSHHEVDMMGTSEIPSRDPEVYTFADLGINPNPLETNALKYIRHYRKFEIESLPMEVSSKAFRK
ncbi:NADH-ubiquinone oxidoreductase [Smittium culicis]|uniref:NADH-ubiquinone oxidoreductase n=1 Tax=Smittium culicis TaxID=133412 RepID=A0A1R1YJR1_9FUNG|nr:NADH-ubiquinone oxidoreductase [Smittium culicis]